jgi:hypothetical protein
MVKDMAEQTKVTWNIPSHLIDPARQAAARQGVPMNAFAARAIRNEVLRQQLAQAGSIDDAEWLDTIEADEDAA